MSSGISFDRFARVVTLARKQGVTVRELAKCFGMSKSTMGRYMQMIDAIEALGIDVKDLGQSDENSPAISTADQSPSVPSGTNSPLSNGR